MLVFCLDFVLRVAQVFFLSEESFFFVFLTGRDVVLYLPVLASNNLKPVDPSTGVCSSPFFFPSSHRYPEYHPFRVKNESRSVVITPLGTGRRTVISLSSRTPSSLDASSTLHLKWLGASLFSAFTAIWMADNPPTFRRRGSVSRQIGGVLLDLENFPST